MCTLFISRVFTSPIRLLWLLYINVLSSPLRTLPFFPLSSYYIYLSRPQYYTNLDKNQNFLAVETGCKLVQRGYRGVALSLVLFSYVTDVIRMFLFMYTTRNKLSRERMSPPSFLRCSFPSGYCLSRTHAAHIYSNILSDVRCAWRQVQLLWWFAFLQMTKYYISFT